MGTKAEIVTVVCANCATKGDVIVVQCGPRTWASHPRGWFVLDNAPAQFLCSRSCLLRHEERIEHERATHNEAGA